jgi:signal transduction histidine kinase
MPADDAPDLLARSVTHAVRQPLSLIVGYAELLAREPDEGARALLLAELRGAAARLAGSLERLDRPEPPEVLTFGPRGEHRVLDLRA